MSDFAQQTFARLQDLYNSMDDFGAAPLYAVIGELLVDNRADVALEVSMEAAKIHSTDHFIVEGETTNNEVFLEVFRRLFFQPIETVPLNERTLWRTTIAHMGTYLHDFGLRIEMGMVGVKEVAPDEA